MPRAKGYHHTAESKAKMSMARKGVKNPKISAIQLGRKRGPKRGPKWVPSAETRAKWSVLRKGRSPVAACAASALANKGRKQSKEHVEKRMAQHRGSIRSLESRALMSEIRKAAFASGRIVITPEQRKALSDRSKRLWANGEMHVQPLQRYTKLAQALHAQLSATGLTLEPEVRFGRFTVDLYDREHHVAYEADGHYWHARNESRMPGRCARRDQYLFESHGLRVVHFTEEAIYGFKKERAA